MVPNAAISTSAVAAVSPHHGGRLVMHGKVVAGVIVSNFGDDIINNKR